MVTDEHVCPWGLKAKDLLRRKGYAVDDRWLTARADIDAFKTEHQVKTTPQVFIDGARSARVPVTHRKPDDDRHGGMDVDPPCLIP
jgi:glutaredoxin